MFGRIREEVRTLADVSLAVRVIGWALVLPIVKHLIPVRSLASVMHQAPVLTVRDAALERRIITLARWGTRLTRWKSGGNCLERGMIAYRYLTAAGAQPTLVIGIGRNERGVAGHAWVLVDQRLVGEPRSAIAPYTPVFAFGPDGQLDPRSTAAPRNMPAN